MIQAGLLLLACYLIGSIPFPVLVSKWIAGIDLRQHGSGNMGATNAARVLGRRWFPLVFGLDAFKGGVAVWLARAFIPAAVGAPPLAWAALGGALAVIGHCYPVLAGFRGGVGLATTAGALLLISPLLTVAGLLAIVLFWALTRNMYVGVALTALCFPFFSWYWLRVPGAVAAMTLWSLVVFVRHAADVRAWLTTRQRP